MNKALQIALNHTMRVVAKCRLRDRVPIAQLIKTTGMQTVNRMSAEDKIKLVWQAIHLDNSPLTNMICRPSKDTSGRASRSAARGDLPLEARTTLGQNNFPETAIRLWNITSMEVREAATKGKAKTAIRKFVTSLPL